jgi:hypothetical protein
MDVIQIIHFRKSESIKNAATQLEATRWRLRLVVGLAQWLRVTLKDCQILRPGRTVAATGKRSARFWRQHAGDCAFWLGSLSGFVQPSRTARYSGLAGQSPLPEKIRTILQAARWRLRFYGRGKSLSSCQYLGHAMGVLGPTSPILIHPPAWWFTRLCRTDTRRYLKKSHCCIATEL